MSKERKFIGEGNEHCVYVSRARSEWIVKKPKNLCLASLRFMGTASSNISKEIRKTVVLANKHGIKTPETRVFTVGDGYLIAQKKITEDQSLSQDEKRQLISETKNELLTNHFEMKPENFLSSKGRLYLVDLTWGYTRILDGLGILDHETQNVLKVKLLKKLRLI